MIGLKADNPVSWTDPGIRALRQSISWDVLPGNVCRIPVELKLDFCTLKIEHPGGA